MIKYSVNLQTFLAYRLGKINLSRQKFISGFVLSLLKNKSVKFCDLAADLNEDAKDESNLRRIQSFFADYELNYDEHARLLMSFIPLHRLDLTIDRTNWKFGKVNINILCLTVSYQGVGVPILFDLLDKRGNSNTEERTDLLDKFITLFGSKCIGSFTADREFIGDEWYKYLIDKEIRFFIRLPKSHRLILDGIDYRIDVLIDTHVQKGEKHLHDIKMHGIEGLGIGLRKLPKNGKKRLEDDYLAILTNCPKTNALKEYKKRWTIETFFQSIKERGFDLEQTHLKQADRLKKLFTLVCLAFVMCLSIGIYQHEHVKSIPIKNHGYKQNSFFRVGLDKIKRALDHVFDDIGRINKIITILFQMTVRNYSLRNLDRKIIM